MQNVLLSSGEEFVTWPGVSARWSDQGHGNFAFRSQSEGDRSQPELCIFRVWSSSFLLPVLFNLGRLDIQGLAHQTDGELPDVLTDQGVLHSFWFAKYAAAFFRN